ncbi:MAG: hypothetical protein ABSF87_10130 [Xanthobacteraceae bacterium]|jgi:hypothetical protein
MITTLRLRLTEAQWRLLNRSAETCRTSDEREALIAKVACTLAHQGWPVTDDDIALAIRDAIQTTNEEEDR